MAATYRSAPIEKIAEPVHRTRPEPDRVVCLLAMEMQVPLGEAVEIYEYEFARLNTNARVTTYISVLALKNVRETLRQRCAARLNVVHIDHRAPES